MSLEFRKAARIGTASTLNLEGFRIPAGAQLHVELSLTRPEGMELWHDFGIPVINLYIIVRVMLDAQAIFQKYLQF